MKTNKFNKIKKPLIISIVIVLVLFFLIDNIIMPYYVQKGKTTKVPNIVGLPLEQAKAIVRKAGLEPKEAEYKTDKRYDIGTVTLQNPIADSEVKYGRGVYLTISGGEEHVDVPSLKGKSIREAAFNLERCGLKLGTVSYEPSEEIFANTVIRQDILPNTKVTNGSHINVIVSQGRTSDTHSVPDISLKTFNEAEKIIIDAGFRIGKITYQINLDILPNTILEQSPRSGEFAQIGSAIDLIVAQKTEIKTKVEN